MSSCSRRSERLDLRGVPESIEVVRAEREAAMTVALVDERRELAGEHQVEKLPNTETRTNGGRDEVDQVGVGGGVSGHDVS